MNFKPMFAPLYAYDKQQRVREWIINVKDCNTYSEIITLFGVKDGKMIETIQEVLQGKNLGKRNETSHYQQAISEAQSKWNKKRDKEGYRIAEVFYKLSESVDQIKNTNNTNNTNDTNNKQEDVFRKVNPMLAQDYKKYKHKVLFPCYIQPKLDGYRCIFHRNSMKLMSRQNKEFTIIEQYHKELFKELEKLPYNVVFDGELYVHNNDNDNNKKDYVSFEVLGVLRKKKNMTALDIKHLAQIKYHIYDIIDHQSTFEERISFLNTIDFKQFRFIEKVSTIEVTNSDLLDKKHHEYITNEYEGTMVRNKKGMYIAYRSYDLLKKKDFDDAEFPIVDFTFELYNNEKLVVWIIEVNKEKGILCDVRPQGSHEERSELYKKGDTFIGKKLWTKFFGFTEKGSLRFPSTQRNTYTTYIRENNM